jgi:streptogramin lyase
MDVAASYEGRVIITGAVFDLDPQTGEKHRYPIGRSAALNTPSIIMNTYVVILDAKTTS